MRERMYYCTDLRCSYDPAIIDITMMYSILHDTSERIKRFVNADTKTEGEALLSLSLTVGGVGVCRGWECVGGVGGVGVCRGCGRCGSV